MLSYYVIYCEKFKKVFQWTEKVALSLKCPELYNDQSQQSKRVTYI